MFFGNAGINGFYAINNDNTTTHLYTTAFNYQPFNKRQAAQKIKNHHGLTKGGSIGGTRSLCLLLLQPSLSNNRAVVIVHHED